MSEKLDYYLKFNTTLDDRQRNLVMSRFKLMHVKKASILLSAGAICKQFYFVNKGCIRTYYNTIQGQERTRYIAFDNSIVSCMASFISQQPSTEFIDALEESELYAISHSDFYQLVADIPCWALFYRKLLEMAYGYQNKKIEHLLTLSAKQRYHNLLIDRPQYAQRLSNRMLASYLTISQETLSRLKSR